MSKDKDKALTELANAVIDASLHWTGEDEEKNPGLKKIRTMAGLYALISDDEMEKKIQELMKKGFLYIRTFPREYVLLFNNDTEEKARISWANGEIDIYRTL